MSNFTKTFRKNKPGAFSVDWIVLSAAIIGLSAAAYASLKEHENTAQKPIQASVMTEL